MRLFTGTSVSAEKEKIPWCKVEMITFNLIVDIVKFVVCSKTLWWRALRERERERERDENLLEDGVKERHVLWLGLDGV